MAKKTLTEAFDVKPKETPKNGLKDYDIFGDKGLLDSLRTKIVQNLIEENIPDDGLLEDYINNEIDNTLIEKTDLIVTVSDEVSLEDIVTIDSKDYTIKAIIPLYSGSLIAYYKLIIKG